MATPQEIEAANWLVDHVLKIRHAGAIIRAGNVQDDWDVRDVYLDVPTAGTRSMAVRTHDPGHPGRDFSIRFKARRKDGTYADAEYFKLRSTSRKCCDWYLQQWKTYDPPNHEFVLVYMPRMRQLGFFSEDRRDEWSKPLPTWNKDAYFLELPVRTLLQAKCVLKCHVHNRMSFDDPQLDANIYPDEPLELYSVQ